jgi:hypothetical protein
LRDLLRSSNGRAIGSVLVVERTAKIHAMYGALLFVGLMVWPLMGR